jgi:hypothetical protein
MDTFNLKKYLAENKLLKEEFVKGTPQYYVKYTTLDGKEVKSELMSKREAIYKERDLVNSGVKKSSVYKIQKNMDLNGKEYKIEYELDKDIEYRTDEEGKPIAENKLLKEAEEPTGFLFRFSKEDAMNKAMSVLDQKDIGYNELGVHLVFHDKFGPATEEEVSEILRGEDILDWVIGEWKGDIYLKSEEEIKNM